MANSVKQMELKAGGLSSREEKGKLEGLPLQSRPYVKYDDVEEYKHNAYGTQGHLQPKSDRGGLTQQ
ncbi:Late embryogenesis abundant protein, LEA-18 [Spatholobus suberectus]|nr:Late embryogenesis abundant protein, LEA-18 [Spatholobus suberectus]